MLAGCSSSPAINVLPLPNCSLWYGAPALSTLPCVLSLCCQDTPCIPHDLVGPHYFANFVVAFSELVSHGVYGSLRVTSVAVSFVLAFLFQANAKVFDVK